MNVTNFIKNQLLLCVSIGTFGLAAIGYMGYHAIRWIIIKCQKAKKVDEVAQKKFNDQPTSVAPKSDDKPALVATKPLINRVSSLEISPDKIAMGQGEYIAFHKLPSGETKQLSPETYEKVYQILIQYTPANINSKECANRSELIKAKLKEIDPTLEAVFVPKTLYELIFIRKCIQEEKKMPCPNLVDEASLGALQKIENFFKSKVVNQKEHKCWHLCHFYDGGDNQDAGVKEMAFRLNKAMVKAFNPSSEGFTHQEISTFAEKEITFLKNHYKNGVKKIKNFEKGPVSDHFSEKSIYPMGIRDDDDARIIRDAIKLECSKTAENSLFLYRGVRNLQNDSVSDRNDKNVPYSISYGTSLFAGCIYDGGATAFYYMRDENKDAYAIPIPFDQLKNSVFFIPTTHTIAQLSGEGEIFHARTKAWKNFDVKDLKGMNSAKNGKVRDHLKSNLSQDELISQFQNHKNKIISLKP